jgi:hypothetical protein
MQRVQTKRLVFVFPIVTRSLCRFGLNRRLAIPVTLVPTPPKYLALPRVVTRFPVTAVLPQTSQCRAIADLSGPMNVISIIDAFSQYSRLLPVSKGRRRSSKDPDY